MTPRPARQAGEKARLYALPGKAKADHPEVRRTGDDLQRACETPRQRRREGHPHPQPGAGPEHGREPDRAKVKSHGPEGERRVLPDGSAIQMRRTMTGCSAVMTIVRGPDLPTETWPKLTGTAASRAGFGLPNARTLPDGTFDLPGLHT